MTDDHPAGNVEARLRTAIDRLLADDIPNGLKRDVTSLCTLAGVPRATLYRTYPHVKAEFDQRRNAAQKDSDQHAATHTNRLKAEITQLRDRLAKRDRQITELKALQSTALSRLAAQHDEITSLRRHPHAPPRLRTLPARDFEQAP